MRYTIRYAVLVAALSLVGLSVKAADSTAPAPAKDTDARLASIENDLRELKNMIQSDHAVRWRVWNRIRDEMEQAGRDSNMPDRMAMRPRMRLGVELAPVTPETSQRFHNDAKDGAFVVGVAPGSAAEKAGLRPGDLATSFRGNAIKSPEDLVSGVKSAPAGKSELTVSRDGKSMVIAIDLGSASEESQNVSVPRGNERPRNWRPDAGTR